LHLLSGAEPSALIDQELLHGHAFLAAVRAEEGELDRADRSISAGERLIRDVRQGERHPHAIMLAIARGRLLELRGDLDVAEATLARAEELARRVSWPLDHAYSLLLLARVEHGLRKQPEARAAARLAHDVLRPCPDPGTLAELLARTERLLQMSPMPAPIGALTDAELSEREVTILRLLASELSQREIGSELYISLNTVKRHVRNIFHKLGVSSRPDAVARGRELGLI
jgi:LuxR family maltose regulon positive regulatory protein